jgi:DNA-binding Lrp family transcriptional regulator
LSVKKAARVSALTMIRIRDYVVNEPSFTVAFAAWELGLSVSAIGAAVAELVDADVVEQIEARNGPYAAVYAYKVPKADKVPKRRPLHLPELDAGVGVDASPHGVIVPHTRARGESDTPGKTRERQKRGVRVRRQGT